MLWKFYVFNASGLKLTIFFLMIGRIEKYLSRGEARVRSTLIVFIANYIEYSSYSQLLDDGVEYIEACKNSGAGLVVIIVDPVPDRYY